MELVEGIKTRRSVRRFEPTPVPRAVIEDIVGAARYAPSWKNSQTARYIVVENRALIRRVARECVLGSDWNRAILEGCPALVVLASVANCSGCGQDGSFATPKGDRWEMFDAGIAAEAFCLAAHAAGVGSVILGIFDDAGVASVLEIPESLNVSALIAVGYPAEKDVRAPARKDVGDLLSFL